MNANSQCSLNIAKIGGKIQEINKATGGKFVDIMTNECPSPQEIAKLEAGLFVGGGRRRKAMIGGAAKIHVKAALYAILAFLSGLVAVGHAGTVLAGLQMLINGQCGGVAHWLAPRLGNPVCQGWNTVIAWVAKSLQGNAEAQATIVGVLTTAYAAPKALDLAVETMAIQIAGHGPPAVAAVEGAPPGAAVAGAPPGAAFAVEGAPPQLQLQGGKRARKTRKHRKNSRKNSRKNGRKNTRNN